ncbi:MAG: NAD(P)/FAD-dependent oxidoreductase, partial [Candidatus Marinimicrobia bacterium]|nr:NAD(P)/FAD-dependent oxidoreductase [Candidatus Neomarinimicrobiota bacterium]
DVQGLTDQIELHFLKEINPGYFWIFPAGNGIANVGLGLSKKYIKKNKKDLVELLNVVTQLDYFKERFRNARPLEKPRGWNLPMGSVHRKNYGNGFMLLGDAAGLIDPFTGEGIGNAMLSAKYAVKVLKEAIDTNDISARSLSTYDKVLWDEIGPELKISTNLQKLARSKFLLNFVINRASRNENLKDVIGGMLANEVARGDLTNPLFYYKILFS